MFYIEKLCHTRSTRSTYVDTGTFTYHRAIFILLGSIADAYKAIYQDIPSDRRRRPGRPRQSWLATIHRDLQKLDIGLDNIPELGVDRILWRGGADSRRYAPLWCLSLIHI